MAGRKIPISCVIVGSLLAFIRLSLAAREYELLGHDSYPILLASRIRSWSDFVGTFTERLMDGAYPGLFYRPLLNLTFAWDYAWWGLDPFGYQITNAALFVVAAGAVGALAYRLAGAAPAALIVAWAVFLLHPAHVEVIPVPARRAELLCCSFLALAVFSSLSPARLRAERSHWVPALWTAAAVAGKESAFVAPGIVFAAVFLVAGFGPARRAAGAHLGAVGLALAARLAVLGTLGGHTGPGVRGPLESLTRVPLIVSGWLVAPQPAMSRSVVGMVVILLLVAAATWVLVRSDSLRAAAVGVVWLASFAGLYTLAGWVDTWYATLPVAGWAVLLGVAATAFLRVLRSDPPAWIGLAALAGWLLWQSAYSPVVRPYEEWARGSNAVRTYLDRAAETLVEARTDVVTLDPVPYWVAPDGSRRTVLGAALLAEYSVEAWVTLRFPSTDVVVRCRGRAML